MKNFFRSVRYLWPYRRRLAISIVCVIFIAALWGGGLGMIAPSLKVLLAPEGLHGWAWKAQAEAKLQVKLVPRMAPAGPGQPDAVISVLDVVDVIDGGAAERAGVPANSWIVAIEENGASPRTVAGERLLQHIAEMPPGRAARLHVRMPENAATEYFTVELVRPGLGVRLLGRIAGALPPPADYPGRFPILMWLLVFALVLTVVRNSLRFVQEYLVQTAVQRSIMDLRCEMYNNVLRLPMTFFSQKGTSDTMSRFVNDIGELSRGQITLMGKTLVEPAKAIASITMAMFFSWRLTLLALVAGPPAFMLIRMFGRVMKHASRRALESSALLLGTLEETLTGIRVVKAYTMESTERKRFYRIHRNLLKQQRRMARIDSATAPSVEVMGMIAGMAAAGLAGYWVLNDRMDPFFFMAWMGCLAAMFDPLRKLAKVATRFQRAEAAAERIFELHDRQGEKRIPGAPQLPRHAETIEFRDVSLRYPGAAVEAVSGADLTIQHNETIAIVGPNGSGKTTLVSLLPRLLEPTSGEILIDGRNIATHSLRSLRRQIGLVTQETVIFHATIGENVAYGLRGPEPEAVLAAAKQAFVDEFVRDLPDGYETMVGERGATLSGGQRQRIAIARAILRDPAILIFDEATSQIDADSERRIHQAMESFSRGRTTLLIAHRFATVMSADRIAVMDAGKIIDVGTHDELIARCRLYAHLYNTQFADTSRPQ